MADGLPIFRRGLMFVLSAPSGAGKTSIARRLLAEETDLDLSVSATTRPRRAGEIPGRDYEFVDVATFERMRREGAFIEQARVFGQFYGTPKSPVEAALGQGRDILFTIDWQGARQLAESASDDVVRVFLLPPSTGELERRLRERGRDPDNVVAERMAQSISEISHYVESDYVVVNSDLDQSVVDIRAILSAERLRRLRQSGLAAFVRQLHEDH